MKTNTQPKYPNNNQNWRGNHMLDKPDFGHAKNEAAKLLKYFGIDVPPVDPVHIARELGVNVHFVTFSDEMDRISGFYDAEENAIYVNQHEYTPRQTFTIAHELGHKIMHEEWAKSNDYRVLLRDDTLNIKDPKEQEANAFAAALLVPRSLLDNYCEALTVPQLSKLFAVSVPVIKNRLAFEYGT